MNNNYYVLKIGNATTAETDRKIKVGKKANIRAKVVKFDMDYMEEDYGFSLVLNWIEPIFREVNFYDVFENLTGSNFTVIPSQLCYLGEYDDYYLLHFHKTFKTVDLDKSEIENIGESLTGIKKLVLSEEKLSQIDDSDKIIFALEESPDIFIFHESIVKQIQDILSKRLKNIEIDDFEFIPIEQFQN